MTIHRAYSVIEAKSFDDERHVIRGIATSPRPDRMGDVVEASGVQVASDIPLFMHHDSTKVVGRAKFGKATKDGIPFEAMLPDVKEAGVLRDRVQEAWQSVKYGLITAVSIGFRALEGKYERMKDGGIRFLETEVLELSLVPVPAQPDAVIQGFKSADPAAREALLTAIKSADLASRRAALGDPSKRVVRLDGASPLPGVSGQRRKGVIYLN
jgi:HK97 family phage prohead protease